MKTAFPSVRNAVTITLYSNVPFDNTYKHHTIISELFTYDGNDVFQKSSGIACESLLDIYYRNTSTVVYKRWTFTDTFNFNYSNGLVASVVLELTPEQTNGNYLKVVSGSDIYYYFVTNITQINAGTYNLSLELDVLMTYQDEFLSSIRDKPVYTSRKHCHRYEPNGLMPYCADLKTGDETFAGVKPSIIETKVNCDYLDDDLKKVKGIQWLYVCCDITGSTGDDLNFEFPLYSTNNKTYPLLMFAGPLNTQGLIYKDSSDNIINSFTTTQINEGIKKLINNGAIHGAKISPYPPFNEGMVITIGTGLDEGVVTIKAHFSAVKKHVSDAVHKLDLYEITDSHDNSMWVGKFRKNDLIPDVEDYGMSIYLINHGFMEVVNQAYCLYEFANISNTTLGITNTASPTVFKPRYIEPKLLFAPFKKYVISAQYSSGGYEFHPELIFSDKVTTSSGNYCWINTITTAYIGDNNYFTFVTSTTGYSNYKYDKIGLASSVSYVFPCGTNALDVFNATQSSSFYQSKIASGVTSGLTIAGGLASLGIGIGATVASGGTLTPITAGLMATGSMAVASGIAGEVTNAKSISAKIEDLKNTPDSINISGSNFITDEFIAEDTYGLPYVLVYSCTNAIKETANDFFYSNGYKVARDCYFNLELKVNNNVDNFVDNNLFTRTMFNYIQISEDITNKITGDIPHIVKQKLSSIFNNGITIWTFFGLPPIWKNSYYTQTAFNPNNWLFKHDLDNTEVYTVELLPPS